MRTGSVEEAPLPFGKYRLLRRIATGGMGEVFLAELCGPAGYVKKLVIKRILRHLASDEGFIQLFLNEARLAALLDHPNVVQIFELGEVADNYFIAMEYVRGRSLAQLLARCRALGRPFPYELAILVCEQALLGLQHAHRLSDDQGRPLGLIHRDVSPENLLVSFEGGVKLTDFGIAKAANLMHTTRGLIRGKYRYMSPEQLRNESVDQTADLYAMGVVLYEMLAGRYPFRAENEPVLIQAVLGETPVPPRQFRPDTPEALERICLKAMTKDRAERFGSASEMQQALVDCRRACRCETNVGQLSAFARSLFDGELGSSESKSGGEALAVELPLGGTSVLVTDADATRRDRPGESSPKSKRAYVLAAAGLLVMGGLVGAAGARRWGAHRPTSTPSSPAKSPAVSSSPTTQPPEPHPSLPEAPAHAPALRPASPRSRASAMAKTGQVVFKIYPWAEVFFEGRRLGPTPLEPMTVPAGTHTFTLRNPDLHVERRLSLTVRAGGEAVLQADLLQPSSPRRP